MIRTRIRRKLENRPFQELLDMVNRVEKKETDYFKKHSICFLGTKESLEYYNSIGKYPDLVNMHDHIIGWEINPAFHLNLGVVAGSGMGKSKIMKNIILQYHKLGWRIIVISPKKDEMSSAKKYGHNIWLHPYTTPEKLPIVSYVPSFVKHWMEKNDMNKKGHKFYSHSISTFTSSDYWTSLGLSPSMASYCVKKINNGVSNLKELNDAIDMDTRSKALFIGQERSAKFLIDNLMGTKFIDEKLPAIDLALEWGWKKEHKHITLENRPNNIVAINYFSQKQGHMMSGDLFRILNLVRETVQIARKDGFNEKVLVVFDDANFYASKGNPANQSCIQLITDYQINLRSLGIDNITAYQFPEVVDGDIVKGSTTKLVSFVEDPNSLTGILTPDAVYTLKASEEEGGLVIDKPYKVQWIYRKDNRDWWVFYPNNIQVGHDFG